MTDTFRVPLGVRVRDRISGYEGISIARCQYLAGCNQIGIKPQGMKEGGGTHDSLYFDEPFVDVIDANNPISPVTPRRADTGGPETTQKRG